MGVFNDKSDWGGSAGHNVTYAPINRIGKCENNKHLPVHGRRFTDEGHVEVHMFWEPLSHFHYERFEYIRVPFYAIFDEEVRRKGPLCWGLSGNSMVVDKYKWSADNSEEIKKGWIIRAKSISEIAKRMSMDESTLENTVASYNESCKIGQDAIFGRHREWTVVPMA